MARLGARVVYTDGQGFEKLGFVTGTRESIAKGTAVQRPDKGSVHLHVISPTGKTYDRQNVPQGEGPRTFRRV